MAAIRDFSFAGSIGVIAAQVSVLLIQCYGLHGCTGKIRPRGWLDNGLRSFAGTVHRLVVDHRRQVIAVSLAVFVFGLLGASQIEPGAKYIRDLPQGNPIRDDFDLISETFGGANNFEIVIEGAGEDAVLLPSVLRAVDVFQRWLNAQPEIGGTTSLVDYVKRLHQAFTTGEPADFRVPENFNLVKQLLIIGAPEEVDKYANLDYSKLIIRVRTPVDDVAELNRLIKRIELQISLLPTGVEGSLHGNAVRLTRTVTKLTSGQVLSFGLAVLAIYLVIAAVFASWRMGFRAMLPNLLPIAAYYGMIGVAGISLSPTMALLSCIVLGVAVDDTLFYLVRFNRAARGLANEERAAKVALNDVIGPVTLTTVALCLCFLTMTTSEFETQFMFAILAATTLVIAWLTDLTLTPAIGARSSIVTLFDVVSVDLGTAPQLTIPLFKDMTARQAKLFALMSRIVEVPAGECFIRTGDPAGDIYVVIEGTGYAWFDRKGEEVKLADFKRGNTFGEASTFIKHRTANVSAESAMRLLAFDPKTLDRIRLRYPRIAALVFRNLSAIQAARLDRTTRKLEALSGNTAAVEPAPAS
jgi:predicted RND superfamily exporter protein